MTTSEKQAEEAKRARAVDAATTPAERWKALQEAITRTEAALPYEQRRNRPRTRQPLG